MAVRLVAQVIVLLLTGITQGQNKGGLMWASALSGICQNEGIVPPPLAIRHSASSRSRLCCRKRSKGCALSPTSQLLLPCEDETVENTIDFHSVSYHRF